MAEPRASMLPTILVSQLVLLAIGMIGDFDPLLVMSLVIALEVGAALEVIVRDAPFARFTAGAHLAMAGWYLAKLLFVQDAMPAWAGVALGVVLFARLLGAGLHVRRGLATVAVLLPVLAMSTRVTGDGYVWAPLAVMAACAVTVVRWPARPVVERSELPGVRVAAAALGLSIVLGIALESLSFTTLYQSLYTFQLVITAVAAGGLVATLAGPLRRWAIGGALAIVAGLIPSLYFGASFLHFVHHDPDWQPMYAGSAMVGALPAILDAFGHVILGAALLVRATAIPGAPLRRLRTLLGSYGLISGVFIVASEQRLVLVSSNVPTFDLETTNLICAATSLLATALFVAFLLSFHRSALQRGLPTARQLA